MASGKRHTFFSTIRFGSLLARCRFLLAGLLLSLLFACSFSFTYRQLEWLVPWHLSDYVSFDAAQRSELERRLTQSLEWHCATQLDAYAEWFREMHGEPQPLTRARIDHHYRRSLEFRQVLMAKLSPDIAALLASAGEAQEKELMNSLERHNRKLEKRYVTASWHTVRERRSERMEQILQRWIGPLTRQQKQVVARWSEALGQSGEAWMVSRRRWQGALQESLRLRDDPAHFAARIHTLFVEPHQLWPESYRQEYARLQERTLAMLTEIAAAGTSVQQHHFRRQLLSWVEDFERFACR